MITAKVTQAQYDALIEKLRTQENITLTGTSGTVSARGVTAQYGFDGTTLTMTILKHPFGLGGYVEGKIKDALIAQGVTPS